MRPLLPLIIVVSVGLGLGTWPQPSMAGLAEGVAAYKQGDFATAVHEFLPLAEHGHAEAQFYLGAMYSKGWGVPQDDTAAAQWYRRAAPRGRAGGAGELRGGGCVRGGGPGRRRRPHAGLARARARLSAGGT